MKMNGEMGKEFCDKNSQKIGEGAGIQLRVEEERGNTKHWHFL
jgi:hypothetical protein